VRIERQPFRKDGCGKIDGPKKNCVELRVSGEGLLNSVAAISLIRELSTPCSYSRKHSFTLKNPSLKEAKKIPAIDGVQIFCETLRDIRVIVVEIADYSTNDSSTLMLAIFRQEN